MCGFGDKVGTHQLGTSLMRGVGSPASRDTALLSHWCVQDRRPITPPPCIRLVVKDATTKEELDIKSVFPILGQLIPPSGQTASYHMLR